MEPQHGAPVEEMKQKIDIKEQYAAKHGEYFTKACGNDEDATRCLVALAALFEQEAVRAKSEFKRSDMKEIDNPDEYYLNEYHKSLQVFCQMGLTGARIPELEYRMIELTADLDRDENLDSDAKYIVGMARKLHYIYTDYKNRESKGAVVKEILSNEGIAKACTRVREIRDTVVDMTKDMPELPKEGSKLRREQIARIKKERFKVAAKVKDKVRELNGEFRGCTMLIKETINSTLKSHHILEANDAMRDCYSTIITRLLNNDEVCLSYFVRDYSCFWFYSYLKTPSTALLLAHLLEFVKPLHVAKWVDELAGQADAFAKMRGVDDLSSKGPKETRKEAAGKVGEKAKEIAKDAGLKAEDIENITLYDGVARRK